MMDEVRWAFHQVYWTLYSDDGQWMAFNSLSDTHSAFDKESMESWLADKGLCADDIAQLFRGAEENGEAALTVSRLHEPPKGNDVR